MRRCKLEGTHPLDASHPLAEQMSARDKLAAAMFQGARWRGEVATTWDHIDELYREVTKPQRSRLPGSLRCTRTSG